MAPRTLADIRQSRPVLDRAKIEAQSEEDIARHAQEDDSVLDDAMLGRLAPVVLPAEIRKRLGLSQEAFAQRLRIPVATLRNWEQGRTTPDPVARSLLLAVAREPETLFRLISGSAAA